MTAFKAGVIEPDVRNTRVKFANVGHVERNGTKVENDHSWLMRLGDREAWVRKGDMELINDEMTIPLWHARDIGLDVTLAETKEPKEKHDPLVQHSLGANSASTSATQRPQDKPQVQKGKDEKEEEKKR